MNWGYKILIVIIVFIIAMLSMVGVAFQQTNEMVETNYYEKEMKYQSLIDAAENLNKVTSEPLLSQDESKLTLRIPKSLMPAFEEGKINFLKSDNEKQDLTISIMPDAEGIMYIDKSKGLKGNYSARISFNSDSKQYYRVQQITVK